MAEVTNLETVLGIDGLALHKKSKLHTPIFRVSYEHINKPQVSKDESTGEESKRWSLSAIFDQTTQDINKEPALHSMVRLLAFLKREKFGTTGGIIKMPYKNGNDPEKCDLAQNPEYEDKWIISLGSRNREPGLVTMMKPKVKGNFQYVTGGVEEFYSGCYAIATINGFAYDVALKEGGRSKGVSFGLCNVIKVRDGEKLTSQSSAEEDFKGLDPKSFGVDPDALPDNAAMFDDLI